MKGKSGLQITESKNADRRRKIKSYGRSVNEIMMLQNWFNRNKKMTRIKKLLKVMMR